MLERRMAVVGETSPRALLRQAVAEQPTGFERGAILAWFDRRAPWVDPLTVDGLMTASTVNDRRRQHFPSPEDLLYARPDGAFDAYVEHTHGPWTKLGRPGVGSEIDHLNLARILRPRSGTHLVWRSSSAA